MGSVAATASVGAAVEVEAVGVAASAPVSVEGVTGGVGDSDEPALDGGVVGVEALCALDVRSIDWNSTRERSASRWSWTRRPAWSPSAGAALPSTTSLR